MMFGQLNNTIMKKSILLFLVAVSCIANAQDARPRFSVPVKNWNLQIVAKENFYPTYLADPLGIRFGVSSQHITYGDIEHRDQINSEGTYWGKMVINPGVRFSLLKFTPSDNPALGIEADLGLTAPIYMRAKNHDLIGLDGIYYFAIAGKPTEWLALRFSKHHICTHTGDEFPKVIYSPTDFDYNLYQLPVRDDFILSASVKPLYFLHNPEWNILHVYGDFGFFLPGRDFLGERQNKPNKEAYLNFQGGAELEYYFPIEYMGGVFAAYNISSYQQNAYSPNLSGSIGYIFPQERNKKRLRLGINFYNGRSWSNNFYNRKEKFIAFFLEADV